MLYPGSFLKLLLVAFSLVALPLVVALITSAIAVDQLANRSETAVYQAVRATQSSRRLSELLTIMERSARQIVILNDRSLLAAYKISRTQFEETTAQFSQLPFDAGQRGELDAIITTEQQIYDALSNAELLNPAALRAQVGRFGELAAHAQSIVAKASRVIDLEVDEMRRTALEARRIMLWQALALIPVVVFLVFGFAAVIARPIRQIDAAIRELGGGKFDTPVSVSGPADLEYLGSRLEWMRLQLINIEQQKNRFLQQISHELKTPLTALREGAQLLSEDVLGSLTAEQREVAEILRQNSIKLQKQIEELLDYTAIPLRTLELAELDPGRLMAEVANDHKLQLQAKNLKLETRDAGTRIVGDAAKIRVVLDNLLSNSIKFSPPGGIIRMEMRVDGEDLVLDVTDQGPGIAPADRPHVFEPFYQGRVETLGPVKGSGLGLSIVREHVMAHGGSAEIVADEGEAGSHFRIRVPRKGGAAA
ncbi:MAG: histidine kinase [Betaproteobacteria bacterium]|jgi:two-component system sensor histidine kinase GlrK|nr:histidine kinase [Betaproteobacteria bacterium]